MTLCDTSPKARAVYLQRLTEMTPSERVRVGVELWEAANLLQRAAFRSRNRHADESEIVFHIASSRFGVELARLAYRKV